MIVGKIRVSRDFEGIEQIPGKAIERGMKYVAERAPRESKERLSALGYVKTGRTRDSIRGEAKGEKAIISGGGSGAEQIHILEYGASPKPHIIKPKLTKGLFWPGARHPMKVINHPGHRIREGRFMRGPVEDMQNGEIESIFSRAIKEVQV